MLAAWRFGGTAGCCGGQGQPKSRGGCARKLRRGSRPVQDDAAGKLAVGMDQPGRSPRFLARHVASEMLPIGILDGDPNVVAKSSERREHRPKVDAFQNHAVVYYNDVAAHQFGKIFRDPFRPDLNAAQFPEGSVVVKVEGATASTCAARSMVMQSPSGVCSAGSKHGIFQCVRKLLTRLAVNDRPVAVVLR